MYYLRTGIVNIIFSTFCFTSVENISKVFEMRQICVLVVIIVHILTVVRAQDGQLIDFNKINLTSEFDACDYYGMFTTQSYTDSLLEPFRSDSETYLTNSQYGGWMCMVTKASFQLEKNAKLSMAINLTSSRAPDQSNVQITAIDLNSGLEHLVIEAGVTNGWKEFYYTFDKAIDNAKV